MHPLKEQCMGSRPHCAIDIMQNGGNVYMLYIKKLQWKTAMKSKMQCIVRNHYCVQMCGEMRYLKLNATDIYNKHTYKPWRLGHQDHLSNFQLSNKWSHHHQVLYISAALLELQGLITHTIQ